MMKKQSVRHEIVEGGETDSTRMGCIAMVIDLTWSSKVRKVPAILGLVLYLWAGCTPLSSAVAATEKWEYADAFPPFRFGTCVVPTERERALFTLAAIAIELVGADDINWMDIGAQKFLAGGQSRTVSDRRMAVCEPDEILKRVSEAFTARQGFGKGRLVEYQLSLASKLPNPSSHIVEAVGQSAFNPQVQPSDTFHFRDIRPFARSVLAVFGVQAKNYGAIAYDQMSMATPMGTGAAQVAAAVRHPNALPRIEQMMEEALTAVPADKAIPRNTRDRLYELAWALYFAGDEGKKYTTPIHKIMGRKVESWAPPFGMVESRPKRLCTFLSWLYGYEVIMSCSLL